MAGFPEGARGRSESLSGLVADVLVSFSSHGGAAQQAGSEDMEGGAADAAAVVGMKRGRGPESGEAGDEAAADASAPHPGTYAEGDALSSFDASTITTHLHQHLPYGLQAQHQLTTAHRRRGRAAAADSAAAAAHYAPAPAASNGHSNGADAAHVVADGEAGAETDPAAGLTITADEHADYEYTHAQASPLAQAINEGIIGNGEHAEFESHEAGDLFSRQLSVQSRAVSQGATLQRSTSSESMLVGMVPVGSALPPVGGAQATTGMVPGLTTPSGAMFQPKEIGDDMPRPRVAPPATTEAGAEASVDWMRISPDNRTERSVSGFLAGGASTAG
ncbi:hypothetical protein EON68_04920, partial [archaeon]